MPFAHVIFQLKQHEFLANVGILRTAEGEKNTKKLIL